MNRITIFRTTPRVVMGPGAISQIGQEVKGLQAKKVVVVTDKGVSQCGLDQTSRGVSRERRGFGYGLRWR